MNGYMDERIRKHFYIIIKLLNGGKSEKKFQDMV